LENLKGILFALFWASATAASKFAVKSADLFLFTFIRFGIVAILLQIFIYGIRRKDAIPSKKEFKHLIILGALNITFYMCGFLIAVESVSAGLISLLSTANPLIIILLSALILKKRISLREWFGILIVVVGLVIAAIPSLKNSHSSFEGITALILGIFSFSLGNIYFSKTNLKISNVAVNTWQITFGTLLFIPIVLFNYHHNYLLANSNFYYSLLWLVGPVSIIGYGLWLSLLQKDPVKTGRFLFLVPVAGYVMSIVILKEPLTSFGIVGTILVLTGLIISRKIEKKEMTSSTLEIN